MGEENNGTPAGTGDDNNSGNANAAGGSQGGTTENKQNASGSGGANGKGGSANAGTATPEPVKVTVPDGVELDPGILKGITESAKDSASAQKVVDAILSASQKVREEFEKTKAEFDKELRADKEFGGTNYEKNMKAAGDFIKAYVKADELPFLQETGLDKHPVLVKIFSRAGLDVGEDTITGARSTERGNKEDGPSFEKIYKSTPR